MARMKSSAPRGGRFSLQGCLGLQVRGEHQRAEASMLVAPELDASRRIYLGAVIHKLEMETNAATENKTQPN